MVAKLMKIMAKTIESLITLTPEQEQLCKEMESLYEKMQEAGIAFAFNEDGSVVAYNAQDISDCCCENICGKGSEGYEYIEQNDMRQLFPIWCCDTLYVERKEK